MEELLTFHTPKSEPTLAALAIPSPCIEFGYAYYVILRTGVPTDLQWLKQLNLEQPVWLEELREFWQGLDPNKIGFDLFHLICDFGYAKDASPKRFLQDLKENLNGFIERLARQMEAQDNTNLAKDQKKEKAMYLALHARLTQLLKSTRRLRFVSLLEELWAWLEPMWKAEGLAHAKKASVEFNENFSQTQDILAALPAHHFVQFESSAQTVRQAMQRGSVTVIPLFFASSGGFSFDFSGNHFVGYGIQTEDVHQRLFLQVAAAANRVKALADPTRLMLLTLLARYQHFEMSVSDFANQLGVTQPTISGHLKLLREAEFVTLEKKGNRSLYQVNQEAFQAALLEVSGFVIAKK
jgi:DNA-binding transcriptional ArsR family regulator